MEDKEQPRGRETRRPYERPKLEVVKVKLDEVLANGCKNLGVFGGCAGGGPECPISDSGS
jgi:hypothetical protein